MPRDFIFSSYYRACTFLILYTLRRTFSLRQIFLDPNMDKVNKKSEKSLFE